MSDVPDENKELRDRVQSLENTLKTAKIVAATLAAVLVGFTGLTVYQLPAAVVAKLEQEESYKALKTLGDDLKQAREKLDAFAKEGPMVARSQTLEFNLQKGKSEAKRVDFEFPVKSAWHEVVAKGGLSQDYVVELTPNGKSVEVKVSNEASTTGLTQNLRLKLMVFGAKF